MNKSGKIIPWSLSKKESETILITKYVFFFLTEQPIRKVTTSLQRYFI